ncbi:MAG: hypothetical protein AAF211_19290 [Myxococcota bacterium]
MGGSVCEQRARALTTALHRELKDGGFRKRSTWLRAHRPGEPIGLVHVLGVQLTQGSQKRDCSAVVTVGAGLVGLPGLAIDLERVRVQDCLVTHRIGDQWDLDDDLDGIASELGDVAREWFAAREEVDAILAPFGDREPGSVRAWLGQVEPVAAASVVLGDRERAIALLEAKRGLVSGRAVERLDELGKALGLVERDPNDDFLA